MCQFSVTMERVWRRNTKTSVRSCPLSYKCFLPPSEGVTKVYTKGLHSDAIILSNRVAVKVLEGGKRRERTTPAKALELGQWIYTYFAGIRGICPPA